MGQKLKKWLPSKRKLMQLYFALLFNANLRGFISGSIYKGNTKKMCAPGINCYSCPGAVGACPLGSLQGAFSADRSTLYYVCGILLLYALAFGRMICGWFCPFGLIQELLYKIKTPKLKKSPVTRLISFLKYAILVFFVFIVPGLYALRDTPLPAFCKYICPAGTLEGGIGLLSNAANASYFQLLGPLFTWKFLLMVSILVGCVFIFRLFCRFLCPLGALYGLFNKISLFGVKIDKPKCTQCGLCVSHCKLDIHHVGDAECISCGECMDVCPTKAIVWKGSGIFLKKNEGADVPKKNRTGKLVIRCVTLVVMLGILAGAIWGYWRESAPAAPPSGSTITEPTGDATGDNGTEESKALSADLQRITAEGVLTETIDPTKTGRITVVNFWGTWCTPCVNELPYFDQIATEYADQVTVIAVHTDLVSNTAPEFIGKYYPESKMVFAKDINENGVEVYYTAMGGKDTYPHTVILDEHGAILETFPYPLHYEDLKAAVTPYLS